MARVDDEHAAQSIVGADDRDSDQGLETVADDLIERTQWALVASQVFDHKRLARMNQIARQ